MPIGLQVIHATAGKRPRSQRAFQARRSTGPPHRSWLSFSSNAPCLNLALVILVARFLSENQKEHPPLSYECNSNNHSQRNIMLAAVRCFAFSRGGVGFQLVALWLL